MTPLPPYLDPARFPSGLQRDLIGIDRDLVGAFNRLSCRYEIWIADKLGRTGRKAWHRVQRWQAPDGSYREPCDGMIAALRRCDTWDESDGTGAAERYIAEVDAEEARRERDHYNACEALVADNVMQLRRDMEKIRPHGVSDQDIRNKAAEHTDTGTT